MLRSIREEARRALVAAGIAGPHQSHAREGTIGKIHALVDGDPEATFGLTVGRHGATDVLGFMAELTGCERDLADLESEDAIDPAMTIEGIVVAATRLRAEAARGATLFAGTGHPTGMLELYIRIVDAYIAAGGKIVRPREAEKLDVGRKSREAEVRYIGNVGCLADWGNLKHTHRPDAMEALLEVEPWPDLVLGDHGFAGAAIERGIPTVAVMDINDHALAIAAAQGRDVTIIPMDDNRPPRLYEPVWRMFEEVLTEPT